MPTPREDRPLSPFRLLTLGGLSLVDSAGTVVSGQRRRLALLSRVSCAGEARNLARQLDGVPEPRESPPIRRATRCTSCSTTSDSKRAKMRFSGPTRSG